MRAIKIKPGGSGGGGGGDISGTGAENEIAIFSGEKTLTSNSNVKVQDSVITCSGVLASNKLGVADDFGSFNLEASGATEGTITLTLPQNAGFGRECGFFVDTITGIIDYFNVGSGLICELAKTSADIVDNVLDLQVSGGSSLYRKIISVSTDQAIVDFIPQTYRHGEEHIIVNTGNDAFAISYNSAADTEIINPGECCIIWYEPDTPTWQLIRINPKLFIEEEFAPVDSSVVRYPYGSKWFDNSDNSLYLQIEPDPLEPTNWQRIGKPQILPINFQIDGYGTPITTGIKGSVQVPFNCTILRWSLIADQSGQITVDIAKSDTASFPTTSNMPDSPPAISGGFYNGGSASGWTTFTLDEDDIIQFTVANTNDIITKLTVCLILSEI